MTPSSNLIFNAEEVIEKEGVHFEGEVPGASAIEKELPEGVTFSSAPHVEFDISVGTEDFLLLGSVNGGFRLNCSRCLTSFISSFEQDLESVFPKTTVELDAGEEIRQDIVLAVPEKPVCKPDCKGLCPICGINLNTNSCKCEAPKANPFAKLGELYTKEDK